MKDSRLQQVTAMLDDAGSLLLDIVDEGPTPDANLRDFNNLDASRQFINSAITYVQYATDPEEAA